MTTITTTTPINDLLALPAFAQCDKAMTAVREALASGFSTEAARKACNERLGRAYSDVRQVIASVTTAFLDRDDRDAWSAHWESDFPFDLHNVRDRHYAAALAYRADIDVLLAPIRALAALRAEVKAYTLAPKKTPKREQPVREGDAFQWRGHCQCCGKSHAVLHDGAGNVAKHGYRVKHGFFNGVCSGQHHAPIEKDRAHADAVMAELRARAARLDKRVESLRKPGAVLEFVPGRWVRSEEKLVSWASLPQHRRDDTLRMTISEIEQEARMMRAWADSFVLLVNAYHGKALRKVRV